jgi:hypothetical protein
MNCCSAAADIKAVMLCTNTQQQAALADSNVFLFKDSYSNEHQSAASEACSCATVISYCYCKVVYYVLVHCTAANRQYQLTKRCANNPTLTCLDVTGECNQQCTVRC